MVDSAINITVHHDDNLISNFHSLEQPELLYHVFAMIVCLGGNIFVWIASYRHTALEMDPVNVGFIQNLAATDIVIGLLREIPTLVSGIARRWVFGSGLCWFFGIIYLVPLIVEMLTVTVISLHCAYGLLFHRCACAARGLQTIFSARIVCGGLWALVVIVATVSFLIGVPVKYSATQFSCVVYGTYGKEQDTTQAQQSVWLSLMFFLAMPIFLIILANLVMLVVVGLYRLARATPTLNPNTFVVVSLVAWSFLISLMPLFLVVAIQMATGIPVAAGYYTFALECLSINFWIKPLIYTFVNVKFKLGHFKKLSDEEQVKHLCS